MVSALAAVWRLLPRRVPSASTRGIGELDSAQEFESAPAQFAIDRPFRRDYSDRALLPVISDSRGKIRASKDFLDHHALGGAI